MKQDLKINYGILDGIIEQLRTYKNALDTMDSSLETLVGFINNNYADSIDAWDELVKDSKKHIKEYREQIGDLLSLFEGYVDDTTAHISPIARNAMMRVDRRDIWANLCQLESGINNNVPKAIRITKNEPFSLAFWDDPTDEEKEKSRSNKAKLDYIRGEISSTQTILDRKMDALWNIFDNKIVPYENTDDAYNNKAAAVKSKYTNFFEGIIDQFEQDIKVATSFIKGLVEGLVDILVGIVTIVVDASIVAVSNHIPDTIEPDFIKNPANEVKAKYGKMISDAIEDPFGIFESIGQGISDTVEEEGIAYIAGNAAPSLIPYVGVVGKAKWLKVVDNGDAPKTNSVTEALKPKVNDLVRDNKAFEGIKQRGVEVVTKTANGALHVVKQLDKGINSVRNGLVYVAENVVGGMDVFIDIMRRNGNIDNNAVYVNVPNKPNVPWNVLDNKVIQENIVAPLKVMFSKLRGGGKGDKVDDKGTVNTVTLSEKSLDHANVGDFTINPKTGKISKMSGGGHGQDNIDFLKQNGIEYNIEKVYPNGVRVGNVPDHKSKGKRTGTGQAWFPENWSKEDIKKAGEHVINMPEHKNIADGVTVFGDYNGVRVGVIKTNGEIGTIFPDSMLQP
ncbi:EndoU domain-containing protein [Metabacillus malikii]|uniref:Bacterial EndoU nuclease domain-containing protein n=1 Tax=Metabacillus malikii TaxID=1504265 RepID=A0ABT9ZI45_9BACI|nr:EndoU domain-containing protein [Metabacillus malikii]MDQ0231486.1 hypothetical protein [Metabacillus malikii]